MEDLELFITLHKKRENGDMLSKDEYKTYFTLLPTYGDIWDNPDTFDQVREKYNKPVEHGFSVFIKNQLADSKSNVSDQLKEMKLQHRLEWRRKFFMKYYNNIEINENKKFVRQRTSYIPRNEYNKLKKSQFKEITKVEDLI